MNSCQATQAEEAVVSDCSESAVAADFQLVQATANPSIVQLGNTNQVEFGHFLQLCFEIFLLLMKNKKDDIYKNNDIKNKLWDS